MNTGRLNEFERRLATLNRAHDTAYTLTHIKSRYSRSPRAASGYTVKDADHLIIASRMDARQMDAWLNEREVGPRYERTIIGDRIRNLDRLIRREHRRLQDHRAELKRLGAELEKIDARQTEANHYYSKHGSSDPNSKIPLCYEHGASFFQLDIANPEPGTPCAGCVGGFPKPKEV